MSNRKPLSLALLALFTVAATVILKHVGFQTITDVSSSSFNIQTSIASQTLQHFSRNVNMTSIQSRSGITYNVTEQAARQIEHYRQGTGLILNLHITHHGGRTVCHSLGPSPDASGGAPSQGCNTPKPQGNITDFPKKKPWLYDTTALRIQTLRSRYHMVAWEFGYLGSIPRPNLSVTNWEHDNLLSVIVMRDPISRLLAESGYVQHHYPDIDYGNATREEWWRYAQHPWFTNNYALRVLAGNDCCNGSNTDPLHLQHAKDLVQRFSIVLDIACLDEGLKALASLLDITLVHPYHPHARPRSHSHAPSRERIGYDDVYDYLLEKNRLDIELYEWSKSLALVDCSKV